MFADDTTNYEIGRDYFQLVRKINLNLEKLRIWLICNKLSLNVLKTEAMLFCRRIVYHPLPPVLFDGQPIPFSFNVKFLGLYLDHKLSWKSHINIVRNKLSGVSGVLHNIRKQVTSRIAKTLFYTLAYPHLIYGNLLWSSTNPGNLRPITIAQKRLMRTIAQLEYNDHTHPVFVEYKMLKFNDICKFNITSYVFKCLNGLIYSPVQFLPRELNNYVIRNPNELNIPNVRTTQSQLFVLFRGASTWNNLPNYVREARTLFCFKRRLKQHLLNNYNII